MKHQKAFCTIITNNYFSWAVSLYESLQQFDENAVLYVAIVDETVEDHSSRIAGKNIKILLLNDFEGVNFAQEIITKYKPTLNTLRWALKPVLISKCLELSEKVIFLDADLYFFNPYQFLFDYLDTHHIILTPHWRPLTPEKDEPEFNATFKHGIYNAGFVGATAKGKNALDYWAKNCLIFCGNNPETGLYHDQVYLNLIPVYFEKTLIIPHQGCNIASWNIEVCKRNIDPITNEVQINHQHPVIFIHFTNVTIDKILQGEDGLLINHLHLFNNNLMKNGFKNLIDARLNYFQKKIELQNETPTDKLIKKLKNIYYKVRY